MRSTALTTLRHTDRRASHTVGTSHCRHLVLEGSSYCRHLTLEGTSHSSFASNSHSHSSHTRKHPPPPLLSSATAPGSIIRDVCEDRGAVGCRWACQTSGATSRTGQGEREEKKKYVTWFSLRRFFGWAEWLRWALSLLLSLFVLRQGWSRWAQKAKGVNSFHQCCVQARLATLSTGCVFEFLIPLCSSRAVQGKSVNKKKRRGGKEGEMGKGALLVAMTQSAWLKREETTFWCVRGQVKVSAYSSIYKVGQNHTFTRIHGVHTVLLAGVFTVLATPKYISSFR